VTTRIVAGAWLVLGIALWNGVFDLYVSRGAREYLQEQAEFELGRGPEPVMSMVMANATRDGQIMASAWAVIVTAAGWATVWLVRRAASAKASASPGRRQS
jgi:hypothetical protein